MTVEPLSHASVGTTLVPAGRIQKLAVLVRRFGWKQGLQTAGLWILRQAFDYQAAIIFRLDLKGIEPAGSHRLVWSYKTPAEISAVLWRDADIQELQPGVRCFVGETGGEQCYLSLVSRRGFGIPGRVSVTFAAETEAYVGNCVTAAAYRGMGIYPRGLCALGSRLQEEGCRWLYLFVERENLASIRGVEKAGFRPIAESSVVHWRGRSKQRWRILPGIENQESVRNWRTANPVK